MKLPQIETLNTLIQLLPIEQSDLLCEYCQRNKEHLQTWEPHQNDEFYTNAFWQKQVESNLQMFNNKESVRLVALNKRTNPRYSNL